MTVRSVGVEEELLLVDPETGRALAVAESVMQAAARASAQPGAGPAGEAGELLEFELQRQQLETNTEPCAALDDLGREVRRCRAAAVGAAARAGSAVAALATSPAAVEPKVVGQSRYQRITDTFGLTAQEQLTCGCHVHVEIGSPDEGVAVLDRVGPSLATLLALSANSPFWQDTDSSYASFRYQVWGRWPSSGPTGAFGSARAYRETVGTMLSTSTLLDSGMVYFDARLSERYPTIEIRICDVCLYAEDAVLIAALCRALVETAAREWRAGTPAPNARAEVLRLAAWRASRSGLQDVLIDPVTWRPEPAAAVADALLRRVGDALADAGDTDTVADLLAAVLRRGNGAEFQRDAYRRSGDLAEVVSGAVTATAG
ncbi:MAG TPA: glutamate--cysteine ligase [Streptosporangiaceae bacterium]|jgi:carboxylate-amine ligase|nr:glutamate--cysteine ligase [Streptosporangiaceae bacterium]